MHSAGTAMDSATAAKHPQFRMSVVGGSFRADSAAPIEWCVRPGSRGEIVDSDHSAARFISSASRTRARCAVLRAASGVDLPNASASSS